MSSKCEHHELVPGCHLYTICRFEFPDDLIINLLGYNSCFIAFKVFPWVSKYDILPCKYVAKTPQLSMRSIGSILEAYQITFYADLAKTNNLAESKWNQNQYQAVTTKLYSPFNERASHSLSVRSQTCVNSETSKCGGPECIHNISDCLVSSEGSRAKSYQCLEDDRP